MPTNPLLEALPDELRDGLTPAETTLLARAGVRGPASFNTNDAPAARRLRAELLHWLCTDRAASEHVHSKGVWVEGAVIDGQLDFEGATLPHPIWLIDCLIKEELVFRDAHTRSIKLSGSHTGSISAQRVEARGFVELEAVEAEGRINFSGAVLAGTLNCEKTVIRFNRSGGAMRAHGLTVRGDVKLNDMCVHGSIELASARIAGDLKISRTKIEDHGDDTAIHADRAVITGSMYARWLEVHKTIRLVGARVEGDLNFDFASFHGDDALSVNARNLHVSGSLFWRGLEKPPTGAVRMLHAVVGRLADDAESWPRADQLILDGFVYGGFGPESPQSAAERLHWLALQPSDGFRAQPYEQLAKVFRSMGREVDARRVLIAKQEVHRTRAVLNRRTRAWLWFLGKSIRYGYEPWRVISFMVAMVLVGWGVFSLADIESSGQFQSDFNAFVYSLDVFVPIVDLHQENRYLPSGSGPAGPWFRGYFWLHIILGWVSSTLLVAAFTGLIRRE